LPYWKRDLLAAIGYTVIEQRDQKHLIFFVLRKPPFIFPLCGANKATRYAGGGLLVLMFNDNGYL